MKALVNLQLKDRSVSAGELLKAGDLSKDEAERLIALGFIEAGEKKPRKKRTTKKSD